MMKKSRGRCFNTACVKCHYEEGITIWSISVNSAFVSCKRVKDTCTTHYTCGFQEEKERRKDIVGEISRKYSEYGKLRKPLVPNTTTECASLCKLYISMNKKLNKKKRQRVTEHFWVKFKIGKGKVKVNQVKMWIKMTALPLLLKRKKISVAPSIS